MKVRTSILIEKEILKKAQELGLNVSKITENTLKEYIEAIEKRKMTNGGEFLGEASLEKKVQRARWDLNPNGFKSLFTQKLSLTMNEHWSLNYSPNKPKSH